MYKNAILLGLCQFFYLASISVGLSFTGIVGESMTSSTALATLPYLFMTATTALLTLYLPTIFSSLGYRRAFIVGGVFGSVGALLAAAGVYWHSFVIFCAAGVLIGSYQATTLYYRFAAADSVASENKSKAIAWVLNGGILAAVLGPIIAKYSVNFFSQTYLGSYLLIALLTLVALPLFVVMKLPERESAVKPQPVSLATLFKYPRAITVILFSAGGYAMMVTVMLASPLAMTHSGHNTAYAATVIQWHMLGMFAPSLFTGNLINRFGATSIGIIGCVILMSGCFVAFWGVQLAHFQWGLMLVGVGWNFMYMAATQLIMQWNELALRAKLQSVNEFITFGAMTIAAGGTGWAYQGLGWKSLLLFAVAVTFTLLILVSWQKRRGEMA